MGRCVGRPWLSNSASRLVLATFLAAGTLVAALPANAAVVNVANEGQLYLTVLKTLRAQIAPHDHP